MATKTIEKPRVCGILTFEQTWFLFAFWREGIEKGLFFS
jgi:hypothetical protein